MRRRLAVLGMQLILAFQAAVYINVSAPPPVRAADGCTVTAGDAGGMVSACADATSYADFAAELDAGMDNLRGASSTSHLAVAADQAGATVTLNGLPAGVTPLDATLPAGTYLVRLTKDGYVPFSKTLTIGADAPGSLTAALEPISGSMGSFEWVHPEPIIAGAGGFPDGSFDITGYVRDKEGADYVSFANSHSVEISFQEPTDIRPSAEWLEKDHSSITTVGVAKSTDNGRTWTVLKTWTGSWTARTWTSDRFTDNQWSAGKPGTIKEHTIRAYYHEDRKEQFSVSAMVPRSDGGVAVYVTKFSFHQPQELMLIWDDLPKDYCREDDKDLENCLGRDHPARYINDLVVDVGSDGKYRKRQSSEAITRYGAGPDDFATYNLVREQATTVLSTRSGGESQQGAANSLPYEGSYKDADYFLAIQPDCCATDGNIWVARNGGDAVLERTYNLGPDAPKGNSRFEELRIGPDGTIYILDHIRGRIYQLTDNGAVLFGTIAPAIWGGLYGPGNPSFNYMSAAFDSGGNIHVAFRAGDMSDGSGNPSRMLDYYVVFPRQKVAFDSVALFTEPSCAACDAARDWLKAAGVTFRENPSDLPADVAASVGAAEASDGFPVIARLGTDPVVKGAADPSTISSLLGVPYPILVDAHPIRQGKTKDGQVIGFQPDWTLMIVEDDQPRVIVQRDEGVLAFAPAGGAWSPTLVLATPTPAPVDVFTTSDGITTSFYPRYPIFPGGASTPYISTARDVPFNTITKVGDLRFLFRSDSGNGQGRFSYTLHTTKSAPTSSVYRASAQVSQLIPATAFDIALGTKGSASGVTGELAAYVTSQAAETDGGDRFQHIEVDLRAQNETAIDGNLQARAIGGSITLDTEATDGTPETREISLILFVDNTRLRLAEPEPGGNARDITSEAVHFTGDNERWVITNNLGLPNSVPCGPDQAILLPPHSTSTFAAGEVKSFELGSCLDALEVAPSVLAGCESWADAQLVLAAQTIDSLTESLAIERTEGSTNYELTYGSRNADVRRIISIDEFHGATPSCATELTGKTAAVVSVSGSILGDGEAYAPRVTVIDSGVDAVSTAATALPGSLAWEREWLEFEAGFLELTLRTSVADEALSSLMFLSTAGKKLGYQRQLLATRALLHCNYEGVEVASVVALVQRSVDDPEALRSTAVCLQSFVLHPTEHWPSFDRALWAGSQFQVGFVGTVINSSLAANPTLGFLVAAATGDPVTYGEFVIGRAGLLETKAGSDPIYSNQATDFALDHLARVLTATAKETGGASGAMAKVVLMTGPVERTAIEQVLTCAKSFGTANPFPKLVELTKSRSYTAGIPCVDSAGASDAKVAMYHGLTAGIHSGTFGALFEASGRDLSLLYAHLELLVKVIKDVERAEERYPAGTAISAWSADLPALDRFVIVRRHAEAIVAARGRQITVREAAQVLAGVTECGMGLVKGVFSGEGILLLGLGVGAVVAGPAAAAVGGAAFFLSGVAFTGLAVNNLTQMWEGMDLTAKTAGICGAAVTALMTGLSAGGTFSALRRLTPAELAFSPPKVIRLKGVASRGKGQAASLEEQAATLAERGETVTEPPVETGVPPDAALEALLKAVPRAKQGILRALGDRLGYRSMTAEVRAVFDDLAQAYGQPGGVKSAFDRRAAQIAELTRAGSTPGAAEPWIRIGGAMVVDLMPGRPKSLLVEVKPGGLSGTDAELMLAVVNDGLFGKLTGSAERGASTADIQAATSVTQAFLRSDRTLSALGSKAGAQAFSPAEASFLSKLQKSSRPGLKTTVVASLGKRGVIDTLREGLETARQVYGVPANAKVTGMVVDYVTSGVYKSLFELKVQFAGVDGPISIAFKKGIVDDAEFKLLVELGGKGLMQRPFLKSQLKGFDGIEAVSVEEWVEGKGILQAYADAGMSNAVGRFDARVFLRTIRGVGAAARAYFNSDLHWDNLKVSPGDGGLVVRAIDFDPRFLVEASPDAYFAASLVRRSRSYKYGIPDVQGYLQGIVDAFAAEPGNTAETGLAFIRQARTNLNDPAVRPGLLSIGRYSQVPDLNAAAVKVVSEIDTFLAGK
jgi:PEGA domain